MMVLIVGVQMTIYFMPHFIAGLFYLTVAVSGVAMGGLLNTMTANEVFRLARGDGRRMDMLSTMGTILCFLAIGLVSLVIGLVLGDKRDDEDKSLYEQAQDFIFGEDDDSEENVYKRVFAILTVVAVVQLEVYALKGLWIYGEKAEKKEEERELMEMDRRQEEVQ